MKIYKEKLIDVAVNGKLRTVSVQELARLITTGKEPALTKQGQQDLTTLVALLANIFLMGDWLLQSPWAVTSAELKRLKKRQRGYDDSGGSGSTSGSSGSPS
jgi:hypothetical protein